MSTKIVDTEQGIYVITTPCYAYHVTLKEYMGSIMRKGLIPQCGPNCKRANDESVGVHFCYSLPEMFNFWIIALYIERDKNGLELLRFNIQNRRAQMLYPSDLDRPGDHILLEGVEPKNIEYLQHTENGIVYSENPIWTPIKEYKIHK